MRPGPPATHPPTTPPSSRGALPDGCAAETAGRAPLLVVGSEAWNTAPPSGGNLPCGGAAQERVLAAAAVGCEWHCML